MAKIQALKKRRNISESRKSELNSAGNALREKTNNEYGFLPSSFRFWPLWLKKSTSAAWGYVSTLCDKIMKRRPGFLACLCKDVVPTKNWLKLLCFLQYLKSRVDNAIYPQDILWICREKTPLSYRDETFVSLSDGFELHGDEKTEEIVLT